MKKLEGQLMIPVGHFAIVVPHLVHAKLKAREKRLDGLRRQLNEVLILSAIGLKQPCLDGIGSFMETLKARPYLMSNFQIRNTSKFSFCKTGEQDIHGLVVGIVVRLNRVCRGIACSLDYRPDLRALTLEVSSHAGLPIGIVGPVKQRNSRIVSHDHRPVVLEPIRILKTLTGSDTN